jgi:hypothetical protein
MDLLEAISSRIKAAWAAHDGTEVDFLVAVQTELKTLRRVAEAAAKVNNDAEDYQAWEVLQDELAIAGLLGGEHEDVSPVEL